jgi:hypothetical protein
MSRPTELTETQHKTRVRVLWAAAVATALILGAFAILAVDLQRDAGETDSPFWRRLWTGFSTQLKSAGDELKKLRPASGVEREIRDLDRRVFPQFSQ